MDSETEAGKLQLNKDVDVILHLLIHNRRTTIDDSERVKNFILKKFGQVDVGLDEEEKRTDEEIEEDI